MGKQEEKSPDDQTLATKVHSEASILLFLCENQEQTGLQTYLSEWHEDSEDHPATTSGMEMGGQRKQQMGNRIIKVVLIHKITGTDNRGGVGYAGGCSQGPVVAEEGRLWLWETQSNGFPRHLIVPRSLSHHNENSSISARTRKSNKDENYRVRIFS